MPISIKSKKLANKQNAKMATPSQATPGKVTYFSKLTSCTSASGGASGGAACFTKVTISPDKSTYTYFLNNGTKEVDIYNKNNLIGANLYDASTLLTKKYIYDPATKLGITSVFSYDVKRQITMVVITKTDGSIETDRYDPSTHKIASAVITRKDGSIENDTYDAKGKLAKQLIRYPAALNNKLIDTTYNTDGSTVTVTLSGDYNGVRGSGGTYIIKFKNGNTKTYDIKFADIFGFGFLVYFYDPKTDSGPVFEYGYASSSFLVTSFYNSGSLDAGSAYDCGAIASNVHQSLACGVLPVGFSADDMYIAPSSIASALKLAELKKFNQAIMKNKRLPMMIHTSKM